MRKHDTLNTLLCTFALALGLSFAPVPNALKPLPTLSAEGSFEGSLSAARELLVHSTGKQKTKQIVLPVDEPPTLVTTEAASQLTEVADAEEDATSQPKEVGMSGQVEAERGKKLDALAATLGAIHVDIVEPCRLLNEPASAPASAPGADAASQPASAPAARAQKCKAYALDPFFDALDDLEAKKRAGPRAATAVGADKSEPDRDTSSRSERAAPVRIVHLSDSLLASDYISDVLRRRLEKRFGSGGRGYLFIDRPSRFSGLKVRTGEASAGWEITKLPEPPAPDAIYGFSGVSFTAQGRETSRFEARGAKSAALYYLAQPGGGSVELRTPDQVLGRVDTKAERKVAQVFKVDVPAGAPQVMLSTRGNVRLFGLALENGVPGVVLDSVGLPGAYAGSYLKADATVFEAQLAERDPALVILMLGGNESFRLDNKWSSLAEIKSEAIALAERVHEAVPGAACLMTSPLGSGVATMGSQIRVRKETRLVGDVLKEAALASGCAYWDMLEAMGGEAAIVRWFEAGLMNADLVHPLRVGADLLGHLLESALARAYFVRHGPDVLADPPGLLDVSGHGLSRTFKKLARLEREHKGRVAIVQLGASHTAGHMFTDEARAILQGRFGEAGRGFIGAGSPSARFKRAGVKRYLSHGWQIKDALRAAPGGIFGLTGISAIGRPQASMEIAFCDGGICGPSATHGQDRFGIYYWDAPDSGRLEVRLDGRRIVELPDKGQASKTGEVKVYSLKAKGAQHAIRLKNVGEDPAMVFGVSQEIDQPGLVYDSLGLPGATAMTADGFDKPAFVRQLQERAADLYVLFYGTNESALQKFDPQVYRQRYVSLLQTLRAASPEADCLIMGPTDRMAPDQDGVWQEVPELRTVIGALHQIAESQGCAFWSARAAMGGRESIGRWLGQDPSLAHNDHVHLTERGYVALAKKMIGEVVNAYGAFLVYASAPPSMIQASGKKKR